MENLHVIIGIMQTGQLVGALSFVSVLVYVLGYVCIAGVGGST